MEMKAEEERAENKSLQRQLRKARTQLEAAQQQASVWLRRAAQATPLTDAALLCFPRQTGTSPGQSLNLTFFAPHVPLCLHPSSQVAEARAAVAHANVAASEAVARAREAEEAKAKAQQARAPSLLCTVVRCARQTAWLCTAHDRACASVEAFFTTHLFHCHY